MQLVLNMIHRCPGRARRILSIQLQITNLFGKDFSIDEQDENGRTPLMISAMWGSSSVMEFLLEKGADKTIKDHDRNDVVFFVKHSSFPRDEDKKEMLSLLEDKNEGCDG